MRSSSSLSTITRISINRKWDCGSNWDIWLSDTSSLSNLITMNLISLFIHILTTDYLFWLPSSREADWVFCELISAEIEYSPFLILPLRLSLLRLHPFHFPLTCCWLSRCCRLNNSCQCKVESVIREKRNTFKNWKENFPKLIMCWLLFFSYFIFLHAPFMLDAGLARRGEGDEGQRAAGTYYCKIQHFYIVSKGNIKQQILSS